MLRFTICRDALSTQIEDIGDTYMTYVRSKTRNRNPAMIRVPISDPLRWIIKEIIGDRKKEVIFDKMPAEQKMNIWLKDMAKSISIDKNIYHKAGRHTFATFFLNKTKDLNTTREILGHSLITETLVYAHVLDKDKREGIACFNSFLTSE